MEALGRELGIFSYSHFTCEQSDVQAHRTKTGTPLPLAPASWQEISVLSPSCPIPTAHTSDFHPVTLWHPLEVGRSQPGFWGPRSWSLGAKNNGDFLLSFLSHGFRELPLAPCQWCGVRSRLTQPWKWVSSWISFPRLPHWPHSSPSPSPTVRALNFVFSLRP